jgi:hypothetical protein
MYDSENFEEVAKMKQLEEKEIKFLNSREILIKRLQSLVNNIIS